MRFPLRLTAEIIKARIGRMARGGPADPLVLRVLPPATDLEAGSTLPPADETVLAYVQARTSPVVWFGGDRTFEYSGMGHLARRVIDLGRTVFVETDGALLRRCIFSFRPVAQLFLAVQLDGLESSHDRRAAKPGLYRAAMEGIQAARLSGFMICVVTRIHEDTELQEIAELQKAIAELDLDGWVLTAAPQEAMSPVLDEQLLRARPMAGRAWANFSRLVEATEPLPVSQKTAAGGAVTDSESGDEACQEGVHVP
jgi:hypothetical protein